MFRYMHVFMKPLIVWFLFFKPTVNRHIEITPGCDIVNVIYCFPHIFNTFLSSCKTTQNNSWICWFLANVLSVTASLVPRIMLLFRTTLQRLMRLQAVWLDLTRHMLSVGQSDEWVNLMIHLLDSLNKMTS